MSDIKETIARRAAAELKDGEIINLGIGLPTLVADHVEAGVDVIIHSENGALGLDRLRPSIVRTQTAPMQAVTHHIAPVVATSTPPSRSG